MAAERLFMETVRGLAEDDIPGVAALLIRTWPQHRWHGADACEAYLKRVLFDNPWRDPGIPSWLATRDGRVVGCYAIMARPMELNGRRLRVAVGCQGMVDPDHRHSLVALKLAQACLSGPQDLTLVDGANDAVRRLWFALGGLAPPLYNLQWTRLLRPARHVLSVLDEHAAVPRGLTLAARPASLLADCAAARMRWNRIPVDDPAIERRELEPAVLLSHMADVLHDIDLRPIYDLDSLTWLLGEASDKTSLGTLGARVVCRNGIPIGWYLYYLRPGAASEVLQIAARKGAFDVVLRCLLEEAKAGGASALRGRLDPRYLEELSVRHCWMRREGSAVLVHSRRPDVLDAIQRGSALLSRLEGEWWLRFRGA